MDDARYEALLAKRERNHYFTSLDAEAKRAKERWQQEARNRRRQVKRDAAKRERPTPSGRRVSRRERADREAAHNRGVLRSLLWADRRARKAVRKALKPLGWVITPPPPPRPRTRASGRAYVPIPRDQWKPIPGRPSRRPAHCTECGRATRPHKARAADFPGTVNYWGRGVCGPCAKGQDPDKRNTLVHDGSTRCADCGWTLRPRHRSREECPGTRPAAVTVDGGFLCKTCHTRMRRRVKSLELAA